MGLSSRFTIRKEATPALLELLTRTTLGTNGACYRHLDTPQRILEADNPMYVSLERDGKVQGNVTFCKRGTRWYVRYFAFAGQKQGSKNMNRVSKTNSRLKQEIADFYDDVFDGKYEETPEAFYAFIDPNNERSKWMADQFGFRTEAQLITQTFSRSKLRAVPQVQLITDEAIINEKLSEIEKTHAYFVEAHAKKGPFYGYVDEDGKVLAFCKITRANWVIERLPGTLGSFFTNLLPFTPGIRKIIKPKNHKFLVPESVWACDNNPALLQSLFEGVLAAENHNMLLWFVDRHEPVWRAARNVVRWGIVHRMTPQPTVDVVVLRKNPLMLDELRSKPIFIAGWDMV